MLLKKFPLKYSNIAIYVYNEVSENDTLQSSKDQIQMKI